MSFLINDDHFSFLQAHGIEGKFGKIYCSIPEHNNFNHFSHRSQSMKPTYKKTAFHFAHRSSGQEVLTALKSTHGLVGQPDAYVIDPCQFHCRD